MRRQFSLTISSQAMCLLLVLAGCKDRSGPDLPATPVSASCSMQAVASSRPVSPSEIRRFDIAGVRLGMRAEDAERVLANQSDTDRIIPNDPKKNARSIIGKAAWQDYSWSRNFRDGSLPMSGVLSSKSDIIEIKSSIYPDGQERVSRIVYSATPSAPYPTRGVQGPRHDIHLRMKHWIEARLGKSNYIGGQCAPSLLALYGDDPHLSDPDALSTYFTCRTMGGMTGNPNFVCDRRRAIRHPWIGLFGNQYNFHLVIEDGEISYSSRYSPGYEDSRPQVEY